MSAVGKLFRGVSRCGLAAGMIFLAVSVDAQGEDDPRLDHVTRQRQLGKPLSDYLRALTISCGARHLALEPWGERGLVALNINQAVRQLQIGLERTYELTWQASTSKPTAYRLHQSGADEGARRRAVVAAGQRGQTLKRATLDHMRRLNDAPPEVLERLAAQGDPWAAGLLKPTMADYTRRVALKLPAAAWIELERTGFFRIPLRAISPDLPDQFSRSLPGMQHRPAGSVDNKSWLSLMLHGTPDRPQIWFHVVTGADGLAGTLLVNPALSPRNPPQRRRAEIARLPPTPPPNDRRFRDEVTLRDDAPRIRVGEGSTSRPRSAKPLAKLLDELAMQTDLPILAECELKTPEEDPKWLQQQWWLAEEIKEKPLHEALDLLCNDFEYEWKFTAGFLVLRPRLWYLAAEDRRDAAPRFPPKFPPLPKP